MSLTNEKVLSEYTKAPPLTVSDIISKVKPQVVKANKQTQPASKFVTNVNPQMTAPYVQEYVTILPKLVPISNAAAKVKPQTKLATQNVDCTQILPDLTPIVHATSNIECQKIVNPANNKQTNVERQTSTSYIPQMEILRAVLSDTASEPVICNYSRKKQNTGSGQNVQTQVEGFHNNEGGKQGMTCSFGDDVVIKDEVVIIDDEEDLPEEKVVSGSVKVFITILIAFVNVW